MGLFSELLQKLRGGLSRTKEAFSKPLKEILSLVRRPDEATLDQIEEALITSDFGVDTSLRIMDELRRAYKKGEIQTSDKILEHLKRDLKQRLVERGNDLLWAPAPPTVVLVAGVNGVGKTTSIAKLAYLFKNEGKKVLLCASDTFRAAAVEQLALWSERIGVDIVKQHTGADPAAVTFDALDAAISRKVDICIVDTAGRLHTHDNLMRELEKIHRVIAKKIPGAPHETLLVLDATTGQNAIQQAKMFQDAVQVSGLFLAKLDGTAKGGIVLAIRDQLEIPVKFVGLGEKPPDIAIFDSERFVSALF